MDEPPDVADLVDRIVREARIPQHSRREDLRRELLSHFEDACSASECTSDAIQRFGPEAHLAEQFHRVHQAEYVALYLAKLAASVLASIVVALVVQVLANLRLEIQSEILWIGPGFWKAAVTSVAVVIGLATAWEVHRGPFDWRRVLTATTIYGVIWIVIEVLFGHSLQAFGPATILVLLGYGCSRLQAQSKPALYTFGAFAAVIYLAHAAVRVTVGPGEALIASAGLVAIWMSTVAILTRVDDVFVAILNGSQRGAS